MNSAGYFLFQFPITRPINLLTNEKNLTSDSVQQLTTIMNLRHLIHKYSTTNPQQLILVNYFKLKNSC